MELPSDMRVHDGGYEINIPKKGWFNRSNFTLTLTGEVQHPSDTMYTAIVKRDDGVQSTGYFALGDIYKSKDLATALNKSTKDGGNICSFQNKALVRLVKALIKDLKVRCQVYRRDFVSVYGLQDDSKVMVINPEQVIFVETGELADIEETMYVCIGKRRPHMERSVETPTSVLPLGLFLDTALRVLGRKTFGVALLAWGSMYSLNIYGWILRHLRHFNLPMLFGEPMVGKSLIASCAAWLNGCPKTAIVSRATLPYVTSMVTTSTLPFVWDDPSTSEEVSQLAIDLGNEAVRGKIFSETLTPQTGCLVTANFDMSDMLKYFSRLLVLYVERSNKTKVGGDAMVLEQQAKAASATLPLVMQVLTTQLDVADVHRECQRLKVLLPTEMRILEGIALNVYVTRQILNLADRYGYMKYVHEYVAETMIPYYRRHLTSDPILSEPMLAQPTSDIESVLYIEKITTETAAFIKSGSVLAVDQALIKNANSIGVYGAQRNKPTKVNGRTKKMAHFPTKNLPAGLVKDIQERLAPSGTSLAQSPSPPSPARNTSEAITETPSRPPTPAVRETASTPPTPSVTETTPPTPAVTETTPPTPAVTETTPPTPAVTETTPPTPAVTETTPPTPAVTESPCPSTCSPTPTSRPLHTSQSNIPAVKIVNRKRKCDLLLPSEVSVDELCQKCFKKGRNGMRWVECELCQSWYHATCMEIGRTQFMKIKENQITWECC